jgi:diguanylate cyclase (GGDEF)-like protein/PAS domain S-box-containing protein
VADLTQASRNTDPGVTEVARVLHAPDRRLDLAFAALTTVSPGTFLHCLGALATSEELPPVMRERLPQCRYLPADAHPLTYVEPSDQLTVHQAWLEACHGPTRVARAEVRVVRPLLPDDGGPVGAPGTYAIALIDLVGVEGFDSVALVATPIETYRGSIPPHPPAEGSAAFRFHVRGDGRISEAAGSVESALGLQVSELLGRQMSSWVHPDDIVRLLDVWTEVVERPDRSRSGRLRLRRADGAWHAFIATSLNALDQPDIAAIILDFYDVQDDLDAEEVRQRSELGYRTLAESMPVGVVVLDDDGRVRFANGRIVTLLTELGATGPGSDVFLPTEVSGDFAASWSDMVGPEFARAVADIVRPAGGGPSSPQQVELLGADGQLRHFLVERAELASPIGGGTIITVQEVTGEVDLSRAHDRLVQVVDEVDDVVVVTDIEGQVSYLNQAARRFLRADVLGHQLRDELTDEIRQFSAESIEPGLLHMQRWSGDINLTDRNGMVHRMATAIKPVADPDRPGVHIGIIMRDVTAERAHAEALADQARRDPLTGLPNRLRLMELLDHATRVGNPNDELALCFIDLDNLKLVNDSLGHGAGDRLLATVATELDRASGSDVVARFGGDEFVVVSQTDDEASAMALAERLLAAMRATNLPGVTGEVSASIGVATSRRSLLDPERLVRDADAAMYAAKRAGRSRCAHFDDNLRRQVSRRYVVETALRQAVADGTPTMHHQPVVVVDTGLMTGMEALCRWSEATPDEFIPIAEDSGLIVPLGRSALEGAMRDAAALRASAPHLAELRMGVNVSARELIEPGYASRTLAIIEASGVPPEHVVLELTESVLIDPRDDVDQALRAIRDAGVALALDDFGVGYSSLSYLRRYPIDILKLDVSYTQSLTHDRETRIIVEAMCQMASRLGIGVVAEGVETPEHFELVRDLGVRWAQGFLLGRAAPVEHWLATDLSRPLA